MDTTGKNLPKQVGTAISNKLGLGTFVTPDEMAEALQISAAAVGGWLREEYIPGRKVGTQWRVSVDDLKARLDKLGRLGQGYITGELASDEFIGQVEIVYCPICRAFDSHDLTDEGQEEDAVQHYERQACGTEFTVVHGPKDTPEQ